MQRFFTLFILATLAASPVMATISVKEYKDFKKAGGSNWQSLTVYVAGLGYGMMVANSSLAINHKQLLFCSPVKLALDAQNYLDIIDKQLEELGSRVPDSMDVAIVLEAGIVDTFPCKAGQNDLMPMK